MVTEVDAPDGKPLYRASRRKKTASSPSMWCAISRDAVWRGDRGHRPRRLAVGREAAGKTGTTQNYHDAGSSVSTDYVASVWVGNDDASPMRGVTGGSLPATIWRDVMSAAEKLRRNRSTVRRRASRSKICCRLGHAAECGGRRVPDHDGEPQQQQQQQSSDAAIRSANCSTGSSDRARKGRPEFEPGSQDSNDDQN